jgi:hypothetical protein
MKWPLRKGKDVESAQRLRDAEQRARETDAVVAEAEDHIATNKELSTSNHWMDTIARLMLPGEPPLRG